MTTESRHAPPHLRQTGTAKQLVVDGKPFLILGGELHNSSSSDLEYMKAIWPRMVAMHFNTVLAPVYWELVEPEEGQFDFALVDGLIRDARRHGLRLVFLWFASWKNGMSSYPPGWVKRDYQKYPRARRADGSPLEVLSPLSDANAHADARAFAALMRHIRAVDGADHTVIMVQVENEVGILGDSRDRSPAANEAFAGDVPADMLGAIERHRAELHPTLRARWEAAGAKTAGGWEAVFGAGPETDELFMAWHYARYIDNVAAAGKAEYDLPLFVNAWLNPGEQKPGDYPTGGPLPHVLDVWMAAAPHLDLLTPDIYAPDFAAWCDKYTRRANPLFIPEMRRGDDGARNVFHAIGRHDAIGVSPFAVDSIPEPTAEAPLAKSYAALEPVTPLLLAHQGRGATTGFVLDKDNPRVAWEVNGYELEILLDAVFAYKAEIGYGLLIAVGPDTFVGVGSGFRVLFRPLGGAHNARAGIVAINEGAYHNGQWVAGRRLNGDENAQGLWWRFANDRIRTERCTVYTYE